MCLKIFAIFAIFISVYYVVVYGRSIDKQYKTPWYENYSSHHHHHHHQYPTWHGIHRYPSNQYWNNNGRYHSWHFHHHHPHYWHRYWHNNHQAHPELRYTFTNPQNERHFGFSKLGTTTKRPYFGISYPYQPTQKSNHDCNGHRSHSVEQDKLLPFVPPLTQKFEKDIPYFKHHIFEHKLTTSNIGKEGNPIQIQTPKAIIDDYPKSVIINGNFNFKEIENNSTVPEEPVSFTPSTEKSYKNFNDSSDISHITPKVFEQKSTIPNIGEENNPFQIQTPKVIIDDYSTLASDEFVENTSDEVPENEDKKYFEKKEIGVTETLLDTEFNFQDFILQEESTTLSENGDDQNEHNLDETTNFEDTKNNESVDVRIIEDTFSLTDKPVQLEKTPNDESINNVTKLLKDLLNTFLEENTNSTGKVSKKDLDLLQKNTEDIVFTFIKDEEKKTLEKEKTSTEDYKIHFPDLQ